MSVWPVAYDSHEFKHLLESAAPAAVDWLNSHTSSHAAEALEEFYLPLALQVRHWRKEHKQPLLLGLSGAQGSGKSTLAKLLKVILERGYNYQIAIVSLDDLYLPRTRRQELGRKIHPLLETRGVPGTHDVPLGLDILRHLKKLGEDETMRVPRFDKAIDDRLPVEQWDMVTGSLDVILFEGWCVGARPQPEYALKIAVNNLEEHEDEQLLWRKHINQHLASDYAELFASLDKLIFLQAPSWESVFGWRLQQEQELKADTPDDSKTLIMNEAQLRRFIAHYERLTRLMLATVPHFADVWVELGIEHEILNIHLNPNNA